MATKPKQQPLLSDQLDQWMFYGFLAIVITLPIAMSRITFDQFDIAKILSLRLLTTLTLAFWAIKMLTSKQPEFRWSKLDFAVGGFLVLVLISTVTSIHFPTALHGKFKRYEGLLTFLNYGIIYFLALQTFNSFKKITGLSRTIVLAGGFVALYGVLQYLGVDVFSWSNLPFEERRSFSTFGNPDLLAGFLVILIPIAVAEFLKAKDSTDNILMGGSLFLGLMSLLTSFTRGAWIGAAVALLVFAIIGARAVLANPRKLLLVFSAFIGIFLVIAVYSASTGHDVMNLVKRIQSATQITEGSAGTRIEIWKAGLKMVEERPFFGLGPDTFRLGSERYETLRYVKMGQGKTVADNAHNYIVQLAAGVGIPATVIFLFFLAAIIIIAIKYSYKVQGDKRLTYAGLIAAIVGYFVHLLFGVSISGSTGVFWVIIGALAATTMTLRTTKIALRGAPAIYLRSAIAVLGIVSIISSYYAVTMFAGDHYFSRAIIASNHGDLDTAFANYERAIGLYKNGRYYDNYGSLLEQAGMAKGDSGLVKRAIAVYEQAIDWEPREADHYTFLASAYLKLAAGPEDPILNVVVQVLNDGIAKRPYAYQSHLLLANMLYYQGNYAKSIDESKFVLSVNPASGDAFYVLARSYEAKGEKAKAKESYEKALSFKPGNPEIIAALGKLSQQ